MERLVKQAPSCSETGKASQNRMKIVTPSKEYNLQNGPAEE
jgi:hypothetical protein